MRRALERRAMMKRACLSSTFVGSLDGNRRRTQINSARKMEIDRDHAHVRSSLHLAIRECCDAHQARVRQSCKLNREPFQQLGSGYQNGRSSHLDHVLLLETGQHTSHGLARSANQIGQFFMCERHCETHLELAATSSRLSPVEQHPREPAGLPTLTVPIDGRQRKRFCSLPRGL
jgi:hypothetical protein